MTRGVNELIRQAARRTAVFSRGRLTREKDLAQAQALHLDQAWGQGLGEANRQAAAGLRKAVQPEVTDRGLPRSPYPGCTLAVESGVQQVRGWCGGVRDA